MTGLKLQRLRRDPNCLGPIDYTYGTSTHPMVSISYFCQTILRITEYDQRARKSAMPRIYTLDTFRFFAASFVVLRHYNSDFRLGLENWIERIGNLDLFVDFFFILSGFVISLTYFEKINCWSDYRKFIGKRLARIYPLHFVTLFFVAGLAIIAGLTGNVINNPEVYQWKAFVPNLLLVHAWGTLKNSSFNVPSWSLSAEWFVYLLFPLFVALAAPSPGCDQFRIDRVIRDLFSKFWPAAHRQPLDTCGCGFWQSAGRAHVFCRGDLRGVVSPLAQIFTGLDRFVGNGFWPRRSCASPDRIWGPR